MSSIYGKINFNLQSDLSVELSAMESSLNHWDADDKGQWHKDNTGLGHLMLFNTPESLNEKLPLRNEAKGLTITADARIDNREQLFEKLYTIDSDKNNITDKSLIPDSTLILKAYEVYGEDCVEHLIGDFAFAIWDEQHQKLFCARDHMGVKPFFYYMDDNFFAFASEKKGLLALAALNKDVNEDYLLKITANIQPYPDETLYTHIKRLNGAHTLSLQKDQLNLKKYWDLDASKEISYNNPQEYIDRFLELFKEAIHCRLRSAYPIGAELSGGLDSSGITCLAAEILHSENRELSSFSYGLSPEEAAVNTRKTEEAFADEVIKFAKVDHPIKVCSSGYSHFLEETDLSLRVNDGPYHQTIWHNPIKKSAGANGVRVLLSGFPGDELVTNKSNRYIFNYTLKGDYISYFKVAIKEFGIFSSMKALARIKSGGDLFGLLEPLVKHKNISTTKNNEKNILSPGYFDKIKHQIPPGEWSKDFNDLLKQRILATHVSMRMELEDRNSIVYKVETRFPMADIRLINFVLALPNIGKTGIGTNRSFYRKAMKGLMPENIVNRTDKTILMQPFLLKEILERQSDAKQWLEELKDTTPAYINYDKLLSYYNCTTVDETIGGSKVRKTTENIIRWKEKSY